MRRKFDPFALASSARACSNCLLDRVDPAERAKVFIWQRKVGPSRRVTLPTPKGDPLTHLAETIRAYASALGSGKGVGSKVDPTRG